MREHFGLILYPLEWVSHTVQSAVAVFADLGRMQRMQVFHLRHAQDNLVGYRGAVQFDFYHTRFERCAGQAGRFRRVTASA